MAFLSKYRIDPLRLEWQFALAVMTIFVLVGRLFWLQFDAEAYNPTVRFALTVLLGVSAIGVLLARGDRRWSGSLLMVGALAMLGVVFLQWQDKGWEIPQLLEGGIQVVLPVMFYFAVFNLLSARTLIRIGKIGVACTFVGHGLYALGVHGEPTHFVELCTNFFGWEKAKALDFLQIVGYADLAVSGLIFVPKAGRFFLIYAFAWGLATAVARSVSMPEDVVFGEHIGGHWYHTLFRLPHGLLPLVLFLVIDVPKGVKRPETVKKK